MAEISINIAKDFCEFPSGRFRKNGEGSGEEFREEILLPVFQAGDELKIELSGTPGYPSSFLEEAFGGLVRSGLSLNDLKNRLKIVSDEPSYETYILLSWQYIEKADKASKHSITS